MRPIRLWLLVALFAVAMAWVEAAAVMYLRLHSGHVQPYQAEPLQVIPSIGSIELVREAATLVMLLAVGGLAGGTRATRFGYCLIAFGLWDISYYVFLRWMGGWPASLLDWDILFLLPLPWWGPVLAPVLISILMISLGTLLTLTRSDGSRPGMPVAAWIGAAFGALLAVGVFTWDALRAVPLGTQAVLDVLPQRFLWPPFLAALALMSLPLAVLSWQIASPGSRQGYPALAASPPGQPKSDGRQARSGGDE